MVTQTSAVRTSSWCGHHGEPLPDSRTEISGSSCPPSPTTSAGAQKPKVRQSPETDAARRRARQSIREYELIWLLRQLLLAVSWPHWRLRCMQPLHGHGKSHGQGWVGDLYTLPFWRGAGREPREENFGATTQWKSFLSLC